METALTFTELYHRHSDAVFRFAFWLTGDKHDAEDLAAEAFARALAGHDRIIASSVRAYLCTIVRNLHASRNRRPHDSALDGGVELVDHSPGPEAHAIALDRLDLTLAALDRLLFADREALLMHAIGGLDYDEIATTLGITTTAAKVKVFRARQKLAPLH
jgi:RNA polymerase sigma-70 factor, ECF subfamily